MSETLKLFAQAGEAFAEQVHAANPEDWSNATPCADWDVRALVNHVIGELLWAPPLLEGKTIAEVGDRFDGDGLRDAPATTAGQAAKELLAAAAEPGAQERTVHLSFGDFPGAEYLSQVTTDVIIHTWDLARALGMDDDLGAGLVAFADAYLAPQIDLWRGAGA